MRSWSELQSVARATFQLQDDEPDWFSVVVGFQGDERTQLVTVEHREALERHWVVIRSRVGPRTGVDLERLLLDSGILFLGALDLDDDGVLALRWVVPLAGLDPALLSMAVGQVAAEADDLERAFFGSDEN